MAGVNQTIGIFAQSHHYDFSLKFLDFLIFLNLKVLRAVCLLSWLAEPLRACRALVDI
jgi:hypothetical protein